MRRLLSLLILMMVSTACTEQIRETIIKVPPPEAEQSDQIGTVNKGSLRAAKLVAAAEPFITPIGFMVADEILDEALKADPKDRKAQFYKLLIAPLMHTRGLVNRLEYLAFTRHMDTFRKISYAYQGAGGLLREFVRQPTEAWKNEEDVRQFLSKILEDQKRLIDFINQNKNFLTRIAVTLYVDYEKIMSECAVYKIAPGTFRIAPCAYIIQNMLRVNRADWEASLQYLNATRIMTATTISYDTNGSLDSIAKRKTFKTQKAMFDHLEGIEGLGRLRSDHRLAEALGTASDFYQGVKWIKKMQPKLCVKGKQRREHLFFNGICLEETVSHNASVSLSEILSGLAQSLQGPGGELKFTRTLKSKVTGETFRSTHVDFLRFLKNPVEDLKTLFPNKYDTCGKPIGLKDPTLASTFKNGDAANLLLTTSVCQPEEP